MKYTNFDLSNEEEIKRQICILTLETIVKSFRNLDAK